MKNFIARNVNDVVTTGNKTSDQDGSYLPLWLVYLGRFHIEAPLYTTDHVSYNNFDQMEINNRHIIVSNKPL